MVSCATVKRRWWEQKGLITLEDVNAQKMAQKVVFFFTLWETSRQPESILGSDVVCDQHHTEGNHYIKEYIFNEANRGLQTTRRTVGIIAVCVDGDSHCKFVRNNNSFIL